MLKRYTRILVLLCLLQTVVLTAFSQYTITIRIQSRPNTHTTDSIFLAGDFNNWHPGKPGYSFTNNDGYMSLQINNLRATNYEFKSTRGDWKTVECTTEGSVIDNRRVSLRSDTTIYISIDKWKDDFSVKVKKHTASANVKIIDTAFLIPQLDRKSRLWIYLPWGYNSSH